jgi:hypothetical protein
MKSYFAILLGSLAVTGLGVTLAMHGEAGDAPGLAGIGILLIVGAFAVAVWAAQRDGGRRARQ